jgi:nucleosome binding factor SPN SPT16 subunit
MAVQLDGAAFSKRLKTLVQSALFNAATNASGDEEIASESADALLFVVGASQDSYSKSVSLQVQISNSLTMHINAHVKTKTWLFGYEFPDTVCLISRERKVYCLCSAKKGRYPHQSLGIRLNLHFT